MNAQPDFLVIGAQRCATSWLYFCLKEHPEIYLPFKKELGYFTKEYDQGPEWYARYFELRKNEKAAGEITPTYVYSEKACQRIAQDLPNAKLIVSLRHPIERAYSQYLKQKRGGAMQVSFEEALKTNEEFLKRGLYGEQLSRYLGRIPRERLLVLLYEDIQKDPHESLRKIFRFLGVDENFRCPSAGSVIPSENLSRNMIKPVSRASRFVREKLRAGWAIDLLKKTGARRLLDRFLQQSQGSAVKRQSSEASCADLDPQTVERLKGYFAQDVQLLSLLLGRDMKSFWKF